MKHENKRVANYFVLGGAESIQWVNVCKGKPDCVKSFIIKVTYHRSSRFIIKTITL